MAPAPIAPFRADGRARRVPARLSGFGQARPHPLISAASARKAAPILKPVTALIDYGSGNLASAAKALARAAGDRADIVTTADPETVRAAERIVLPGVGAFAACMAGLGAIDGMIPVLREKVIKQGAPFLGICVGMQLLATAGREFGRTPGLGWIAGEVAKIAPADPALKIPHMGWNVLVQVRPHPLLEGIADRDHAYFVHSFALTPALPEDLIATTDHGGTLAAMVGNDNIAGVQFHPEKSQALGLKLLANFLGWRP